MTERILRLSEEEAAELKAALRKSATELGELPSLDGLLSRWASLINEIERGYEFSAYDYTNDLGVRDKLEQLTTLLTPTLRSRVMAVLTPLDERFTRATQEVKKPLLGGRYSWWARIPRRRDKEFDETM